MPPTIKRFESYPLTPGSIDHVSFVSFVRYAARVVAPEFSPPHAEFYRHKERDANYGTDTTTLRLGDEAHGCEVVHTIFYHPHWGYPADDDLTIHAYGLPEACAVKLRAEVVCTGLELRSYLELQVDGSPEAIAVVVAAFEDRFRASE
jgi:hypothetical protein